MLSTVLYTLYTVDCRPAHTSNTIVKFADSTTMGLLIFGDEESDYSDEVKNLYEWHRASNPFLNTTKTKEMILYFRSRPTPTLQKQ